MKVYLLVNRCENFDAPQIEGVFLNYATAHKTLVARQAEQDEFGCCNFVIDTWTVNES